MKDLKSKIENMGSGDLWEVLCGLARKYDAASCAVYEIALDAFEQKVTEDKFCEALEKLDSIMEG